DVLVRTEHREARTLRGSENLFPNPAVTPDAVFLLGEAHRAFLLGGLAGFAQDALTGVADALALVGLGLAKLADVGGNLADELLVEAAHCDARRLRDFEGHARRRLDVDRVGEADEHFDLARPLRLGAVAD